jgi:hypothetical protein
MLTKRKELDLVNLGEEICRAAWGKDLGGE